MKTFKNQCVQGDLAISRVLALPENLKKVQAVDGKYVAAHSETGHHHAVLEEPGVTLYQDPANELVAYLVVENETKLEHHRSYNTHETVKFDAGIYRINRQREYTPEGWRRAAD